MEGLIEAEMTLSLRVYFFLSRLTECTCIPV